MRTLLAFFLGTLGCVYPGLAAADAPPDIVPAGASPAVQTPYHTEEEWIVSTICRNAFKLLAFAADKKGEPVTPAQVTLKKIPGDTLAYDVTVKGAHATAEATLTWPEMMSLWTPAAYVPFCEAAAKALKLPPAGPAEAQGDPLHKLLDFTEAAIEEEDQRISPWLAAQPDNADAHEQAALDLGMLAMKENSGYFWDPRDICNQVCAHLAVAKFLRGNAPMSIEGRLANITIGLIVDTKAQTARDLDALAAEKSPPPELAAWLNACQMRNSRDWRIVKSPESATGFEQVEYFRAYAEAVDANHADTWLQTNHVPFRIDWTRIVLEMGFSVDMGHEFATPSVPAEINVMQTTFPGQFDSAKIADALNEPVGDAVTFDAKGIGTPTVINRGMWAQFFQRHLCHAIAETGNFYANKWSVPEQTQELDNMVDSTYSGLTLYPYLQLVQHSMRPSPALSETALGLFNAHPELAPDCLFWIRLPPDPDAPALKQAAVAWFTPPVVHGTAYGAMSRAPKEGWPNAEIDRLYAIAPLQIRVAQMELKRLYGKTYTLAQVKQVMGPLMDYYGDAAEAAKDATGMTPDEQAKVIDKMAATSPNGYWDLAQYYLKRHQDDKAAEAYQKWADATTDRVEVSDNIDWLVEYYYDHGQKDKALALATEAADVYSSDGLRTMMKLQEKMGNIDDAEGYGQKIQERYNETDALSGFYKRQVDKGQTRYQAKLDGLARTAFPSGMTKVTLASFSTPPTSGVKFSSTSDEMKTAGLSSDLVVVALDGYGTQNKVQYVFVRTLSESPDMTFIVWDGKGYREVKANQPGRHFGVDLLDFSP